MFGLGCYFIFKFSLRNHQPTQSVSRQTFLRYPTWRFKFSNTCMLDNSALCQLPRQSFKHINFYCSRQSISWPSLTVRNLLNNRALLSSFHLRIWIGFTPYKRPISSCKQCWISLKNEVETLMVKIRVLLDTKFTKSCLSTVAIVF